jgi:hypothetical protein
MQLKEKKLKEAFKSSVRKRLCGKDVKTIQ